MLQRNNKPIRVSIRTLPQRVSTFLRQQTRKERAVALRGKYSLKADTGKNDEYLKKTTAFPLDKDP